MTFRVFFQSLIILSDLNFHGSFIFLFGIIINLIKSLIGELACFSVKINGASSLIFFSLWVFFEGIEDWKKSRKGEWTIFFPFYHFHPLTNTQTFICSLVSEMSNFYYLLQPVQLPCSCQQNLSTSGNWQFHFTYRYYVILSYQLSPDHYTWKRQNK